MLTPSISALSRSTESLSWGTEGKNVVFRFCNSGRLAAAAMKICVCSAKNGTVPPERSCKTKFTPPEVPTPGMAGGEKAKAMADGSMASLPLIERSMALYCVSGEVRSPHGLRVTKKNALYVV